MFKIVDDTITMDDLMGISAEYEKPKLGTVVNGKVVSVSKNRLVIDINGVNVGVVRGKETHDSSGTIKDLKEGDEVKTVVIDEEDDDGMVVLSLKKASQATTWDRFEKAYKDGDIINVTVSEANKGGLLIDVDGIKGFIPVSQLAPVHYPRVEDANTSEILTRLQRLIGEKLDVKVINLDRSTGKMILSERAGVQQQAKKSLTELNVGDRVTGTVSGVVKFGIFVTFDGLEGLVHISEIAWGHVSNPHQYARVGDKVDVEIIGIEGDKLSLSMKRLIPDPWSVIEEKYPIGTKVKGTINRFSPFGAFVQLEDDINGLIHLSEISNQKVEDPADFLDIGQEVDAVVINIDRDEHRIGLSLKGSMKKKEKAAQEEAPEDKKEEEVKENVTEPVEEEKEAPKEELVEDVEEVVKEEAPETEKAPEAEEAPVEEGEDEEGAKKKVAAKKTTTKKTPAKKTTAKKATTTKKTAEKKTTKKKVEK
jgi:small subunit ribosomal protein S1